MPDGSYVISPGCLNVIRNTVLGTAGSFVVISIALPFIGFGAAGPIAGSLAAWAQSLIGASVSSGSMFALLQSIGMSGFALGTVVQVTGGSAALACAICNALGHG